MAWSLGQTIGDFRSQLLKEWTSKTPNRLNWLNWLNIKMYKHLRYKNRWRTWDLENHESLNFESQHFLEIIISNSEPWCSFAVAKHHGPGVSSSYHKATYDLCSWGAQCLGGAGLLPHHDLSHHWGIFVLCFSAGLQPFRCGWWRLKQSWGSPTCRAAHGTCQCQRQSGGRPTGASLRMMSWGAQSLKVEFHPGAGENKSCDVAESQEPKSATYSISYNAFLQVLFQLVMVI